MFIVRTLIIRGKDNLIFEEINKNFKICPSMQCKKGDSISKFTPNKVSSDVWIYTIDHDGYINFTLNVFLCKIKSSKEINYGLKM